MFSLPKRIQCVVNNFDRFSQRNSTVVYPLIRIRLVVVGVSIIILLSLGFKRFISERLLFRLTCKKALLSGFKVNKAYSYKILCLARVEWFRFRHLCMAEQVKSEGGGVLRRSARSASAKASSILESTSAAASTYVFFLTVNIVLFINFHFSFYSMIYYLLIINFFCRSRSWSALGSQANAFGTDRKKTKESADQ